MLDDVLPAKRSPLSSNNVEIGEHSWYDICIEPSKPLFVSRAFTEFNFRMRLYDEIGKQSSQKDEFS